MFTKTFTLALLVVYAEARFGQEQIPAAAIQALGDFGNPGEAATLAGQVPSALLAGSNACDKLSLADEIVAALGNSAEVIAAAQGLVGAEKNTNPFAVAIPSLCSDVDLPATAELQGIIPLIDPDTEGADVQNANAATSLQTPFDADGLSVADISAAQGFANFTAQGSDGSTEDVAGADEEDAGEEEDVNENDEEEEEDAGNAVQCGGAAAPANGEDDAADDEENADADADVDGAGDGLTTSSIAGLDFGLCIPTMDLLGGRNNRPVDELTFAPNDALLVTLQPEALDPLIIINFLCDALTNFCDANQAAKDACEAAQDDFEAIEDLARDASTAQDWNAALGFANVAFE
ncbi:hypothetical protein MKZ38_007226 [Zalerion maritima]|uniref:Uncharacterized protein n=1 Tax=Zalerion maritima TaxID=339359 RepID=A0AAD5WND2_9PEZI|nr:hypothetical protein MKZ38_007226 [Zalerion maritima]